MDVCGLGVGVVGVGACAQCGFSDPESLQSSYAAVESSWPLSLVAYNLELASTFVYFGFGFQKIEYLKVTGLVSIRGPNA